MNTFNADNTVGWLNENIGEFGPWFYYYHPGKDEILFRVKGTRIILTRNLLEGTSIGAIRSYARKVIASSNKKTRKKNPVLYGSPKKLVIRALKQRDNGESYLTNHRQLEFNWIGVLYGSLYPVLYGYGILRDIRDGMSGVYKLVIAEQRFRGECEVSLTKVSQFVSIRNLRKHLKGFGVGNGIDRFGS